MVDEWAYNALGAPFGASVMEIKATFYAKAKQYHPDRNSSPDAAAAFQRVHEAYRILIGRQPALFIGHDQAWQGGEAGGRQTDAAGGADAVDLIALVRSVLVTLSVTILFDGTIRVGSRPQVGYGSNDVDAWLTRTPDWSFEQLFDEMMITLRGAGTKVSVGEVKRALRKIVREDQQDRANFIMRPLLFARLNDAEWATARAVWSCLAAAAFEGETDLIVAVLQHLIWQVKRKQLELPVDHHLIPIIVSRIQGTGKTTFVRLFIGVLQELASAPVLLSDLADRRSGDVFRFPITFADDIEILDRRLVPSLKSVLTTGAISRRRLGSSMADKRPQHTTMIGTANESVCTHIPDFTGHRRFAELAFRNGNVARGGDKGVWKAVEAADYALLWRSVNAFAPSPILPHLSALAALQGASAPPDRLRDWLVGLDLDSDAVAAITIRGGVRSDDLRLLFCAQTGEHLSANRFAERMAVLIGDPAIPLKQKVRVANAVVYPRKYPRQPPDG